MLCINPSLTCRLHAVRVSFRPTPASVIRAAPHPSIPATTSRDGDAEVGQELWDSPAEATHVLGDRRRLRCAHAKKSGEERTGGWERGSGAVCAHIERHRTLSSEEDECNAFTDTSRAVTHHALV